MKTFKSVDADVLRGTMRTAVISDLKDQCFVFLQKHPVAIRCFRCLGNIFREMEGTTDVACDYCKTVYETNK